MLLNSLYSIDSEQVSPGAGAWSLTLQPNHPVFSGHFPGMPVVPGVCSIQMVLECAGRILEMPLSLSEITQCKFMAPITPHEPHLSLQISLTQAPDNRHHMKASLERNGQKLLTLKATVKPL